jgi:hypothetical protein
MRRDEGGAKRSRRFSVMQNKFTLLSFTSASFD